MPNDKVPDKWGTSAARFYARCEGEEISIHLITGDSLTGVLIGIDKYDLFIERADVVLLIAKHAVAWIEPSAQDEVNRRLEAVDAANGSKS